MNNLHRELAPISTAAWADLESETRRTFVENCAVRRVVDVVGPSGPELAAVGTGHLEELEPAATGVLVRLREVAAVVELRVPFVVSRRTVDDVERGAKDADWQPAKDAAQQLAFAEDRLVIDGLPSARIEGIRERALHFVDVPGNPRGYPTAVAQSLTALRLAGVGGGYALLLPTEAHTVVDGSTEDGYPIREHLERLLGPDGIIWAPALSAPVVVSTRGGDFELHLGRDAAIGYLSHDATSIELYLEESLTFRVNTDEAAVDLR
jgi:uncharacterized linocin/CFP29 family protein